MTIKVSSQLRQQIQQEMIEYGLSGDIGGLPRTTYYTPDGRTVRSIANFHTNQVGQVRDANLDRGWLMSPPTVLKPFCRWCDRWHDTQEEVDTCGKRLNLFVDKTLVAAKQDEANEVLALKNEVAELKALLNKFMEVQNGKVLQSTANEPIQVPSDKGTESGTGEAKGSV